MWGSGRALQGLHTLPQSVEGARVGIMPHALACTWRGTGFIAADGRVNVLGPNDFLQHGTGAASASSRGIVTFAKGDSCVKLLAGSEHFCAVLSRADGSARIVTWGWGEHGQLGNGAAADSPPCSVVDIAADEHAHVASGAAFVCVALCSQ
jgi:alpha-tubulin suppressor-like RCC1 family protein